MSIFGIAAPPSAEAWSPSSMLAASLSATQHLRCLLDPLLFFLDTPAYCAPEATPLPPQAYVPATPPDEASPIPPLYQGEGEPESLKDSDGVNQVLNTYNSYPTYISNPITQVTTPTNSRILDYINQKFQESIDFARNESRSSVNHTSRSGGLILSDVKEDLSKLDQSLTVAGDVTATSFYGDGSHLSGIDLGSSFSTSTARALFSATSPLTYNNASGVFGIARASSTQDGYLASSDFAGFNGKVSSQWVTSGVFYLLQWGECGGGYGESLRKTLHRQCR